MTVVGTGHRATIGLLSILASTLLPSFSLILFTLRQNHFPIKRSGRSKLVLVLMYISILCTLPFSLIEHDPESFSCLGYKLCAILHIPLWVTPLLVMQLQFFREAKIHAKLAKLANEVGFLRKNKDQFDRLVEALKSDRHNLRRNLIFTYAACFIIYAFR